MPTLTAGKKPFSTPPPPAPPSTSSDSAAADTPHGVAQSGPAAPVNSPSHQQHQQQQQVQQQVPPLVPTWPHKSLLDVAIRLSPELDPLAVDLRDSSFPSVTWTAVEYSNTKWGHVWETEWAVPDSVQHNASFFLDAFVTRTGLSPDPRDESYPGKGEVLHIRKRASLPLSLSLSPRPGADSASPSLAALIRYAPQKRVRATKNLLSGKPDDDEDAAAEAKEDEDWKSRPFVSYYYPNVTLELVGDAANVAYATLPPPVKQHVHIAREGAKTFDDKQAYFPILFPNTFWDLSSQLQPVNTTTPVLPLRVEFKPSGYFKFQLQSTMDEAFTKQSAAMGGASSGGELDEIKRILIETNPVLLITTVVVSVLHMLFEFLAFAGDIAHTRSRKGLVGVSVRTILTNVFVQFVVLLYLIDRAFLVFSSSRSPCLQSSSSADPRPPSPRPSSPRPPLPLAPRPSSELHARRERGDELHDHHEQRHRPRHRGVEDHQGGRRPPRSPTGPVARPLQDRVSRQARPQRGRASHPGVRPGGVQDCRARDDAVLGRVRLSLSLSLSFLGSARRLEADALQLSPAGGPSTRCCTSRTARGTASSSRP